MSKVLLASEFDIKKIKIINEVKKLDNGMRFLNIHYDGDQDVYIQTPEFKLPFDVKKKYEFLRIGVDVHAGCFKKRMVKMDRLVSSMAMKNSQKWLKKSKLSKDTLDLFFNPAVQPAKGTYPPIFNFKTDKDTIFFDKDNNVVESPTFTKDMMVKAIIRPKWVNLQSCGKFGITWVARQIVFKPSENDYKFPPYVDSDEEWTTCGYTLEEEDAFINGYIKLQIEEGKKMKTSS